MAANHALALEAGTGSWRRSASRHPRRTRCSARWRPCRSPACDTMPRTPPGCTRAVRRGADRGPGRAAGRSAAARPTPTDPPTAVLVRVSAQRYNEPADYERLADGARPAGSPPRRSPRGSGSGRGRSRRAPTRPAAAARRFPRSRRERMRHPRIAAVGVVLDDDERRARPEVRGQGPDGRDLPIARRRSAGCWPRPGHRAAAGRAGPSGRRRASSGRRREPRRDGLGVRRERAGVAVHGDDLRARPEQVGQGERERAVARADVRPGAARLAVTPAGAAPT